MKNISGYIGRKGIHYFSHILNLMAFTYRILLIFLVDLKKGKRIVIKSTVEQIFFTSVQALTIIIPIALIIGTVLILQFIMLSGQYDLGKIAVLLIVREIGPLFTALIIILRSATAVTIEIGYMNVLNEIEFLEMSGIDPLKYLCIPRLIGITSAIFCLFVIFDIVAIFGGYAIVWLFTDLHVQTFMGKMAKAVTGTDIFVGLIKAVTFGFIVTIICLYHGFRTKKQITHIAMGTSKAALECFFFSLVANIIISGIFYL